VSNKDEFRHLVRCKFLKKPLIDQIFQETELMERVLNFRDDPEIADYRLRLRQEVIDKGITVASWFYEESLRTRWSHERAAISLGARVISTENAIKFSSAAKGESLEHGVKVISGQDCPTHRYADLIVMRHPEQGTIKKVMKVSGVPVINAGDGIGEHPTQALLDLYTIFKEFGRTDNFTIAMVGDLLNGRTIHSLAYLLAKFPNVKMYFVSDPKFAIKDDLKQYLLQHDVWFAEKTDASDFSEVIKNVDVVYMTRVQRNRFNLDIPEEMEHFKKIRGLYILNHELADGMEDEAIIMHPMPIESDSSEFPPEIRPEVDNHRKARFFKQAGYGVPIRMAVIKMLLENWGYIDRIEYKQAA